MNGGKLIVLTAPLTESIDHAGYFIQMSMASLPIWLEGILNKKYPKWRDVERNDDGSARYMPAGLRVLEAALLRAFDPDDIAVCYPEDVDQFIGPDTRVVAISTHNPLGVTFAAGVYASIFGSNRLAINSHYAREMFARVKANPFRKQFKVIVGGSGGWQISQTNTWDDLSVDCIVEGRAESADTINLFSRAIRGEDLPRQVEVGHARHARRDPRARQAHDLRRRRDDDRVRAPLPVLPAGPESADRRLERPDHVGRPRQRARRQQPDLAGDRRHVHLGPGAHRHAVLFPESRGAARSLLHHRQYARRRAPCLQPLDDRAGRGRSAADREADRDLHRQEPDQDPAAQHASGKTRDRPAHRPRNRLGARGQADHAEQGRAVSDRRLAERVHPRAGDPEQAQLVPGRHAHHRQPRRDRRGLARRRSISSTRSSGGACSRSSSRRSSRRSTTRGWRRRKGSRKRPS